MAELSKVIAEMERLAPPALAMPFDAGKIGLIIGRSGHEIERITIALDPTKYAILKALDDGSQLLITHHTLIWNPINKIDEAMRIKTGLLTHGNLALYCAHTNWDAAPGGVNETYAGLLGIKNYGVNRIGGYPHISGKISGNRRGLQYAGDIMDALNCDVNFYGDPEMLTRRVVAVAGSGFRSALDVAKEDGADTVVSSEVHHDQIREAADYNINIIDVSHYSAEFPAMKALAGRLEEALKVPVAVIDDRPNHHLVDCPRLVGD